MSELLHPYLIEPKELYSQLGHGQLLLIDLCKPEIFNQAHIANAIHLDYSQIVHAQKPVMGMLPSAEHLSQQFSKLGIKPDSWVVAYDDEGGGRAARLLWTLQAAGHPHVSLLNGGIHAWIQDQLPLTQAILDITPSQYDVDLSQANRVSIGTEELIDSYSTLALVDTRTAEEFSGEKKLAERAGHIPGAVNVNWLDTMDKDRGLRLLPDAELLAMYENKGITKDRNIAVYCHSHHRSAHTFILLKHLGYERVRGYPGSWSEWGNRSDTPVEPG